MLADSRRRHHAELQALRATAAHNALLGAAAAEPALPAHGLLPAVYVGREVEQLTKERDYLLSCLKAEVRA